MSKTYNLNRVDGHAKVTGSATYAAEHKHQGTLYGYLVGSTIAKGRIKSIDAKAAEWAPGIVNVITHLNSPKIPGYHKEKDPSKPVSPGQPLRIFFNDEVFYYDQPIALVIGDTYERVRYAASLIKAEYTKTAHQTDIHTNLDKAKRPTGDRFKDYVRGNADGYKSADVVIEEEYIQPIEVHNPMELGSIVAKWEGDNKITVYTKTQGVQSTQKAISEAFMLPAENVTVHAEYVGGAFGMALKTWPYEIAAVLGAKRAGSPVKIVLHREQMFTNVGSRPVTVQKIGMGATKDGKLTGITHEATAQTSSYEEFTEATVNMSRFMYACPNVTTRYKLVKLDTCTPIWMRGPGEATGAFALESAMDELAYKLKIDPVDFRMINHADSDPERNLPWSSKYLKECYEICKEKIGWKNRPAIPGSLKQGEWLVGYGMGTGTFGAHRNATSVRATLRTDGTLLLQCSVNDMGPGTATMMTAIGADAAGIPADKIVIDMGSTGLPKGPMQGGSATTASVGSAVVEACGMLKEKLAELAIAEKEFKNTPSADLLFSNGTISLSKQSKKNISYTTLLKNNKMQELVAETESKPGEDAKKYSMYSFSVHFVKVLVNSLTGKIKLDHAVSCADAGTIINEKTAAGQMTGGAVGGIGMALMEDMIIDHRFGRPINNNLADYHVPVNADIPRMEAYFVNKKDPYTNPMGSKGLGEIALVGMAPAIANAVFNATGKRIRELPITLDKVLLGKSSI
ncbi:MAG: xanthine dehydrogenase family protein molybdopterin-binding subunit [Flavobacterium sp.]|nr:MAG: xanthine dehydrogenase family protein molybdopterin-binding subunit [Flavobacterium sp.]